MNTKARNVKMACLASLIVGVISLVGSIVMTTQFPYAIRSYLCIADSLALMYLGFQGARWINVPSNAGKVMTTSSVIVLLCFVCAAFLTINPERIMLQIFIGSVAFVLSLLVFVSSKAVVNELKRQ